MLPTIFINLRARAFLGGPITSYRFSVTQDREIAVYSAAHSRYIVPSGLSGSSRKRLLRLAELEWARSDKVPSTVAGPSFAKLTYGELHQIISQHQLLLQHSQGMLAQLRSVLIQADGDLSDAQFRSYIRSQVEKTLAPLASIQ